MKMDKKLEELKNNVRQLDESGRRDVLNYGRLLLKSQEEHFEPPTAEQFAKCPEWLKWKFALMLLPYAVQSWLLELGLKIGAWF
jgi:hypothetical protein